MKNNLSKPTILFHWLTGLTFIAVLAIGLYMSDLPMGADKWELMAQHKSFGVILFVIAIIRLMWRFKEGSIKSISELSRVQSTLASVIHYLLLLATILMPVSGLSMSIGGGHGVDVFGITIIAAGEKIEWLSSIGHIIHINAVNVIIAALLLHVAGALKHQIIDKDGTLSRMLGNFHK